MNFHRGGDHCAGNLVNVRHFIPPPGRRVTKSEFSKFLASASGKNVRCFRFPCFCPAPSAPSAVKNNVDYFTRSMVTLVMVTGEFGRSLAFLGTRAIFF